MMPNSTKEKTNRPVHEIRLGRIKAAIWENESKDGLIRHNVKLTRIYKDEDTWKDSDSFGRDDLLIVAKVADRAHSWIHEQKTASNNGESSDDTHF